VLVVVGAACSGDDGSAAADTGDPATTAGDSDASSTSSAESTSTSDPDDSGDSTTVVAVCGDGAIEGAEQCDDGNVDDGDGCSADCATATCLVPVTHATIQAGLDDGDCPVVWVASGEYSEFLDVERDVELVGTGPTPPVIDAMTLGRVVDVGADLVVALRRLEIAGGSAQEGGAIRSSGTLELDDVVVRDSRVEGVLPCGGAIWSDGTLVLVASTVRDNESVLAAEQGTATGGGICIAGGSLQLRGVTRVTGNVARVYGPDAVAAEGGGVFVADASVEIGEDVVIADNRVEVLDAAANALGRGAGMRQQGGTLTLVDATIEGNAVVVAGTSTATTSLIAEGGGLALLAVDATLERVIIANNTASVAGGGVLLARGGGVRASGVVTVTAADVHIAGNTAIVETDAPADEGYAQGGGVFVTNSSGSAEALVMRFDRSAITGNAAHGPTLAEGGGVLVANVNGEARTALDVVDSTLAENTADHRGGAVAAGGSAGSEIAIVLRSATISACESAEGGGLWLAPGGATITVDAASTALVGNLGSATPDCEPAEASLDSSGANALGELACMVVGGTGDLVGVDPVLAALADNGGPTPTLALAPESPLRNAGDPAGCVDADGALLATDQRGEDRHAEGVCDIGAFELIP